MHEYGLAGQINKTRVKKNNAKKKLHTQTEITQDYGNNNKRISIIILVRVEQQSEPVVVP